MESPSGNTLSRNERLKSKISIATLMKKGRWGSCSGLKYCYLNGTGCESNHIMVSVPKRFFKRAVKRNLLKRRLREAYRTQKQLLTLEGGTDIMFLYNTADILDFQTIKETVASILTQISEK